MTQPWCHNRGTYMSFQSLTREGHICPSSPVRVNPRLFQGVTKSLNELICFCRNWERLRGSQWYWVVHKKRDRKMSKKGINHTDVPYLLQVWESPPLPRTHHTLSGQLVDNVCFGFSGLASWDHIFNLIFFQIVPFSKYLVNLISSKPVKYCFNNVVSHFWTIYTWFKAKQFSPFQATKKSNLAGSVFYCLYKKCDLIYFVILITRAK